MLLPTPLLRNKKNVHKNDFGHVLILAGSPHMLGAAALSGLAAMRSGAGLVTLGVAKSLNLTLQRKISPSIMTWPLPETKESTIAFQAAGVILKRAAKFDVVALGPGLSQHPSTQKMIYEIVKRSPIPLVIDADALNAIAKRPEILRESSMLKILTPHLGEMSRLMCLDKNTIEKKRKIVARDFAVRNQCILVLKGYKTLMASPAGKLEVNTTGNPGMAKAGSGDVLTGIISALLAQKIKPFDAVKLAVFIHGMAGDIALKKYSAPSLLPTDLIDTLPLVFKRLQK